MKSNTKQAGPEAGSIIATTGFKYLRAGGESLNGQHIYPLDGTWSTVPGNGSYVSMEGEGVTSGGVGPLKVRLEVEGEVTVESKPNGVRCWRRVRVVEVLGDWPRDPSGNFGCTGCTGCADCTDCKGCKDCANCAGCWRCTGCKDCTDCTGCKDCASCTDCADCADCAGCAGCTDCTDCADCKGCTDLLRAHAAGGWPTERID